ncbi:MAG TPA: cation diffusion facilitator family transporter [Conexivisphaerales archaeon]|nr:cation diffusion facilitator family transporter [Conexivisphaerales archaeon]
MTQSTTRPVIAALIANLLVALVKIAVAIFSGSSAAIAEAVHSISDTVNQVLLLTGINLSRRPASAKHPFGRGKEQFFWSFLVSLVVFWISAVFSIAQGISRLGKPPQVSNIELTILSLAVISVVEASALYVTRRHINQRVAALKLRDLRHFFQVSKDPVILATFLEDTVAVLGVVVALLGVSLTYVTKNEFFDAAAAIVIGIALAVYGIILSFESKDLLVGEGIGKDDIAQIEGVLKSFPEVVSVADVRGIYFGPDVIVLGLEIEFRDDLNTGQLESTIDAMEKAIRGLSGKYHHIYVEAERSSETSSP